MINEKEREKSLAITGNTVNTRPPYWKIFKQCSPQLFNIFFVFFITLSLFPSVQSGKNLILLMIFVFFVDFDFGGSSSGIRTGKLQLYILTDAIDFTYSATTATIY